MVSHLLAIAAMLATARAQYSSTDVPSSTTSTTRTSQASTTTTTSTTATHTVQVGSKEDPHQYLPHNITAAVGDVIVFEFYPRNHSVVKADYLAPCVPASGTIFYSGIFNSFNEQDGDLVGPPPTWSLVVNDTKPTFFYCTAIDSCIGNGMVGVINPNATMTWEAQYEKAKTYPYMLVPGQSMPAEGTIPPSSSATSTSTPSSSSSHSGLSTGAIVGIVIGSVAFVGLLGALFFLLGRNRVYKQWMSSQDGRHERTARWAALLSPSSGNTNTGPRKSEMEHSTGMPQSEFPGSMGGMSPPQQQTGGGLWGWDSTQPQPQPQHQVYQGPGHGQGQVYYEAMARGPSELEAPTR
ncbi:hypothetical protein BO94DRAFT_479047 [Aspergillus sclerotioniger CBS 115572]|uniref:Extracellular serine-rich protein n=1 Tax=Aspergillus sclerotioniger CBS 115572 TaxID=1450535 RepID=A0A317V1H2_9EURO|nr:hypothetical protein BO94DRAFT_479047 [Aspergillus sclerotioniger CBS 115572]PWY67241.1 hypothetical protein BO94DRAFT_479047 [Aspergillus sclerotioniger CBS 115572]